MSAEAEQIRRDRLIRNLETVEETCAYIRASLDRGLIYHVATGADDLVRATATVSAAAMAILRNTPWPGAPATRARAKQEATR